mmetsp:Transcript_42141/g.78350  ORF Transcript_42141/g.78350 Transcript_42141/m.78350 type:complete len:224 (+) Transcript_42141:709-1380(+)
MAGRGAVGHRLLRCGCLRGAAHARCLQIHGGSKPRRGGAVRLHHLAPMLWGVLGPSLCGARSEGRRREGAQAEVGRRVASGRNDLCRLRPGPDALHVGALSYLWDPEPHVWPRHRTDGLRGRLADPLDSLGRAHRLRRHRLRPPARFPGQELELPQILADDHVHHGDVRGLDGPLQPRVDLLLPHRDERLRRAGCRHQRQHPTGDLCLGLHVRRHADHRLCSR